MSDGRLRNATPLAAIAIAIGTANGLVFLGFEWVVKHGTDWIWNDLANSDESRWRVLPLAIALSLALTAVMRAVGQPRWTSPHVDPLADAEDEDETAPPPTAGALATILLVGAASLLAGASLGPEASLVAFATGIGAVAASRGRTDGFGQVLVFASVGALLVAFFGSLIPIAAPLLILYKRTGRVTVPAALIVGLAGFTAWGTLWLVRGDDHGYGAIPSAAVHPRDYLAALILGVAAAGLGGLLRWFVDRLGTITEHLDNTTPWWVLAIVFGGILGGLYLIGGPTVQFSGSEGSRLLLGGEYQYGGWALVGIALVKLLATSWSLASGYRGGLVFPTVFAGIAVSLAAAAAVPGLAGPGILIGSVAGLLVEMTVPALGVVMLLSLLPAKLLPLGLVGAAGAVSGRWVIDRYRPGAAAV
jgi:H+/Cl- antiporter ClcA